METRGGSGEEFTRVAGSLLLAGLLLLLGPATAWAECNSDADCDPGRICVEVDAECDSDDNCSTRFGCEADPNATPDPLAVRQNICDADADCEAPLVCRDIGALHDACAPEWLSPCSSDADCDAGDRCNVFRTYCTPEWLLNRRDNCDGCSEELVCRHVATCLVGLADAGSDDFDCRIDFNNYRCAIPRVPCDSADECGAGERCAYDVSNPTRVRGDESVVAYCNDEKGEVDGDDPMTPIECEEGGTICLPAQVTEYELFREAGRVQFYEDETIAPETPPASDGARPGSAGASPDPDSSASAPQGSGDDSPDRASDIDGSATGADESATGADESRAGAYDPSGGGCSIAPAGPFATGTTPIDSAPTLLLLLAGLIWARRKGWQAHVA